MPVSTLVLIDPDGPLVWLGEGTIVGRSSFRSKSLLILVTVEKTVGVAKSHSVGLVFGIDEIMVSYDKRFIVIVSYGDKVVKVVNTKTWEVVNSDNLPPPDGRPIQDEIFSSSGRKVVRRVRAPGQATTLEVLALAD